MIPITVDLSYEDIINKIKSGERFSFSRYGDGEMNAVFKYGGQNCDGHSYFPDMGKRLLKILESLPKYYIGLQRMAHEQRPKEIDKLTADYNLKWCRADILHHANIKGQLQQFFDALKDKDILIVGPPHLSKFTGFGFRHIQIPARNCWLAYDTTRELISNDIYAHPNVIILYCASMMANVLINFFQGRCTQIDAGSIFEPHVGISSRRYHNKVLEDLKKKI